MNIDVEWLEPFDLRDGHREGLIYAVEDFDDIPETAGIYVFARLYGKAVSPLYIGRAEDLSRRVDQQLNNVRLMRGIEVAQAGNRVLYVGEIAFRSGQRTGAVLKVVESALINAALAEGFELLNIRGTNSLVHTIESRRNREACRWMPSKTIHLRRGS